MLADEAVVAWTVELVKAHNNFVPIVDSARSWRRRHTAVVCGVLLVITFTAVVGLFRHLDVLEVATRVVVPSLFLLLAASERSTTHMRSLLATAGMFVATTGFIGVSDQALTAHLVVPVALVLTTVYRRPAPWVLGLSYTFMYYGFLGVWDPNSLFSDSIELHAHDWIIAFVGCAAAASIAAMVGWLFDVDAQRDNDALSVALAEASLRQRQAVMIHDDVIQGLVTAKYALEAGESDLAMESVTSTLEAAKDLVGGLLRIEGTDLATVISRDHATGGGELAEFGSDNITTTDSGSTDLDSTKGGDSRE